MKIVFSDLDGTLLTRDKRVHPLNLEAFSAFAEKGGIFVPCTGRPLSGLVPEIRAVPGARYAICANGASVYDLATGECLHRIDLGLERCLALYEKVRHLNVTFDVFADGTAYAERFRFEEMLSRPYDPHFLEHIRQSRVAFDEKIEDVLPAFEHVERISTYWIDPADRDVVEAVVKEDPSLDLTTSEPYSIEIADKNATKGAALEWLCAYLGIDVADSVAFGDGLNDGTMLSAAGVGVAMSNAAPGVAEYADAVTAVDCDGGGVGDWVLKHL